MAQDQTQSAAAQINPLVLNTDLVQDTLSVAANFGEEEVAASGSKSLVVYGQTLDAYTALTILGKRGVPPRRLHFMAPPGGEHKLVATLRSLAKQQGVELPAAVPATLTQIDVNEETQDVTATWEVSPHASPACWPRAACLLHACAPLRTSVPPVVRQQPCCFRIVPQ